MVAVGLSPRNNGGESLRVAERRLNRGFNRVLQALLRDSRFLRSLLVGLKPTAYGLALPGRTGRALAPQK